MSYPQVLRIGDCGREISIPLESAVQPRPVVVKVKQHIFLCRERLQLNIQ